MLQAIGLTKTFGNDVALEALDLAVAPGEIFCLLGANGAGKTTTINLFLGFLRPTAGQAIVDGIDVAADPLAAKRRLVHIPEQVALFGELTGYENLEHFAALAQAPDRSRTRLRAALAEAGLDAAASVRRAQGYSKGMRQKVGVALAIVKHAPVLLLDEPTSGLDPQASAEFHDLLLRRRDAGAAILMVTHDLFRAREVGTRIGLMRGGRLRRTVAAADIGAPELEGLYLEEMGRRAA